MSPTSPSPVAGFPPGSEIQRVAFLTAPPSGQRVLIELPAPFRRHAVLEAGSGGTGSTDTRTVLLVPSDTPDDEGLLAAMQTWVRADAVTIATTGHFLTLQGSRIFWHHDRFAILAPADRLETLRNALLETAWYDGELQAIERALGDAWPEMEADLPLSFEFDHEAVARRRELRERYRKTLVLRARLARVAPQVHSPHVHPATLASQVAERYRERTRMLPRHEFLSEQIEVFERVYENCSQRASDFMLTRSSNTLEWIIIILLLVQTLLTIIDLLPGTPATDTGAPTVPAAATASASGQ